MGNRGGRRDNDWTEAMFSYCKGGYLQVCRRINITVLVVVTDRALLVVVKHVLIFKK